MALAKMGMLGRLCEFHVTARHPHGDVSKRLLKGRNRIVEGEEGRYTERKWGIQV